MKDIQQSELIFFLPVITSYALACAISLVAFKKLALYKNKVEHDASKPWKELLVSLVVVAIVMLIGRIYSAGLLIPSSWGEASWLINNLIIYSPIFIVTAIRKQPFSTFFVDSYKLPIKVLVGLIASILSVLVFVGLRDEWTRLPEIFSRSFSLGALDNFVPVFLEGVALAYLFVRLKWVGKLKLALLIPSILFAIAHVPGMLADNDPWLHIILMSLVTGSISIFVLYTCNRTRDIIWLGLVHYFMDVAIKAF